MHDKDLKAIVDHTATMLRVQNLVWASKVATECGKGRLPFESPDEVNDFVKLVEVCCRAWIARDMELLCTALRTAGLSTVVGMLAQSEAVQEAVPVLEGERLEEFRRKAMEDLGFAYFEDFPMEES